MTTTSSSTVSTGYNTSTSRYSFDYDALIEAAVNAKLAKATTLEDKVTVNETKISAYKNLQSLLTDFQDAAQALRAPVGTLDSGDDVFLDRSAYLTSSSSTAASNLMGASVEAGTATGTHTIVISQVATAEKLGSGSIASRSEALGYSGSFTLGAEDGTATAVTVTGTMSLDDIADQINSVKTATGVGASVIKVADNDYMLVLTATNTAQDISITDTGGILASLGIVNSDGTFANELQANQQAVLEVDGVTIRRDGNDIDDALDGITLNLYAADSDTTLTLECAADLEGIEEAVQTFVDTYNSLRDLIITNQTVDSDGTASDDATLFGDSTLRSISAAIASILSDSSDGYSLADVGLTFDENNKLELDTDTLESALVNNLDMVQSLFSYDCTVSDGDLALLSHDGNAQESLSFTLDVTVDGSGNLTAASVGGNTSLFTIDGNVISGAEGTIYKGLSFVYSGSSSSSITVDINQGLADRLYAAIEPVADSSDGTLTDSIDSLDDANTKLESRVTRIEEQASDYEEFLYEKYSRIEAKLAAAEAVLDALDAYNNASSNS